MGVGTRLGCCIALAAACVCGQTADRGAPGTTVPALARPGGWKISPMEGAPYSPLGLKDKFYLFNYRTIDPQSFAKSAFTAGIAQWRDSPEEWGQGMAGFGRRYGHRLLNRGVENMIGFGVAAALHQDGRYFRRGEGNVGGRLLHAMKQTFVTRTDSGGRTFSAWRFAGNYGSQFVSNAWRPEGDRDVGDTLLRGTISIGFDLGANSFKEFWPDIKRIVFRKQ